MCVHVNYQLSACVLTRYPTRYKIFVKPIRKRVGFVKQAGKELERQARLTQANADADGWAWAQGDTGAVEHTLKLWERCTADLGK